MKSIPINVIYEDNHLLVVEKPINIPTQEDDSKDIDFLTMLKDYIKVKYDKPGNVFLGLVHRLDRPVGGIMVFAKTSKCASRLSEQIRTNKFNPSDKLHVRWKQIGIKYGYIDSELNILKGEKYGR